MNDPLVRIGELDQSAIARWAKRAWKAEALNAELLTAAKHLASAVELIDNHYPQPRTNEADCEICVALFEAREAIAKAEGHS
jgi:hypothetical protein